MAELLALINETGPRALVGLIAAGIVAMAAHRAASLSISGAVAATAIGGAIVTGAGWWSGAILVLYFVSSSAMSHFSDHRRQDTSQSRGKQRDAVQVVANGGVAAVLALASLATSQQLLTIGMFAAIAAATSDTWATELGRLSNASPRLITTGKRVDRGTSGGVSIVGTAAAFAGSSFIGLLTIPIWRHGFSDTPGAMHAFLIVVGAGFAGAMVDSLLGATLQQQRWCPTCGVFTERNIHACATVTTHATGVRWLNNDAVNALSIAIAAALGLLLLVATTR